MLVDDRSVVDLLVNGDSGVNVGVLDGLPVDHGLDGLVDVVVNVLLRKTTSLVWAGRSMRLWGTYSSDGRGGHHGPVDIANLLGVVVKVSLLLKLLPVLGEHVLIEIRPSIES